MASSTWPIRPNGKPVFSATTPTDVWCHVRRLHTPALVIRGEHSQTFQPAGQGHMAHRLPQPFFVTISDAGHLEAMERPVETGRAIRQFMEVLTL